MRLGFRTIVLDPPWGFNDKGSRLVTPYPTMTDQEILELPVGTWVAPRSHCYLWSTDTHLELAFQCLRRWGFAFKSLIPWVKVTKAGKPRIGGGHYLRKAHEVCLFATRGHLRVNVHDVPSVILAPRGAHSEKPEALQDNAERLSPGPRLEVFARRTRRGWTCWGNEIGTPLGGQKEEKQMARKPKPLDVGKIVKEAIKASGVGPWLHPEALHDLTVHIEAGVRASILDTLGSIAVEANTIKDICAVASTPPPKAKKRGRPPKNKPTSNGADKGASAPTS